MANDPKPGFVVDREIPPNSVNDNKSRIFSGVLDCKKATVEGAISCKTRKRIPKAKRK
jgi:hypothetical protein